MPVSTFGKKYVDFGGMLSPAAATSRTWSTGVPRHEEAPACDVAGLARARAPRPVERA